MVKMFVTIRSWMNSIMDLIGPELLELSVLDTKIIVIFYLVYTLTSANIDQSAPDLIIIYVTVRSPMSLIMVSIRQKQPKLFYLEL